MPASPNYTVRYAFAALALRRSDDVPALTPALVPRFLFVALTGLTPDQLPPAPWPPLPPPSSSPIITSLAPLVPARSLVSLASLPAAPPPGVAPLLAESVLLTYFTL